MNNAKYIALIIILGLLIGYGIKRFDPLTQWRNPTVAVAPSESNPTEPAVPPDRNS